jgi:murein DD-endopeptidase MepM/ murein hydrolase activator NlpD
MHSKHLTLIVLSSKKGKVRQFKVRRGLVTGVLAAVALSLGVGGYGVNQYLTAKKDRKQMRDLRRESRNHQGHIENLSLELEDLRDQLLRLHEMDKKIRIIANIQQPPFDVQLPGMGGVNPDEGLQLSLMKDRKDGWAKRVQDHVSRLQDLAEQQERSFQGLDEQLREKRKLLSSTPSIWPTQGFLSCSFGFRQSPFTGLKEFHRGLDVSSKTGTPVIAPAEGVVVEVGHDKDFGEVVRLEHGFGYTTFYAHLSETVVKKGQRVHRGQMIARVGNTGRTTGPHLHYELHVNGLPVNPQRFILN